MVLGNHVEGFLRLVLVDEESGRFGNPPDADELDDGRDGLDEGDGAPGPVVGDGGGAPADDGDNCALLALSLHHSASELRKVRT